jgi:opacity protein-like surface antigen
MSNIGRRGSHQQIALLLLIHFPLVCFSGEADSNKFFISGSFIAGVSDVDDIQTSGAITGAPRESDMDDAVGGFAGGVGYQWNQFLIEAEYLWRYRFDFDNRFAVGPTGIKSDVESQSVMLNLTWHFYDEWLLKPYIGAGIGWIENDADTKRTNLGTGAVTNIDTSTDDVTWALMAGVIYPINSDWVVKVGYRYADLGEIEMGPFADGGKVTVEEYDSHDFTLSVLYFF